MRPRAYSGSAGAGAGSPYTRDWRKLRLLAAAIGGVGAAVLLSNYARGCGIVGYVGPEPAVGYLLEGIQILQNRGYDSAGLCTITGLPLILKLLTLLCSRWSFGGDQVRQRRLHERQHRSAGQKRTRATLQRQDWHLAHALGNARFALRAVCVHLIVCCRR